MVLMQQDELNDFPHLFSTRKSRLLYSPNPVLISNKTTITTVFPFWQSDNGLAYEQASPPGTNDPSPLEERCRKVTSSTQWLPCLTEKVGSHLAVRFLPVAPMLSVSAPS